ncbi:hypothetical protein DFH11DRAFT_1543121 [Phellopilus nigrolimitatus]|nr:hypothetical protein DFH11DRAFT_1543121 [Phellopilus nigrolimitatus]
MTTNSEDKRDVGRQAVAIERNEADIVELFGDVIRLSLLLMLSLLRFAQRGMRTVIDNGYTSGNGPRGDGPGFPDLRTYVAQGLTSASPDAAATFTSAGDRLTALKAEGMSSSAFPCAEPSSAGPSSSQKKMRWYVITAGLRTGVFNDWLEAGRYVSGITGAIFKGYDSEEEATEAFNEAVRAGHVRVVPDVNNILNRLYEQAIEKMDRVNGQRAMPLFCVDMQGVFYNIKKGFIVLML